MANQADFNSGESAAKRHNDSSIRVINDNSYNIRELEVDPAWIKDLGDDYRAYRKRWDIACQGYLFDFPLFLEVETSYACNYRCPKCPRQAVGHTKNVGFLSTDLLDKIFAEARKFELSSLAFSHGGEPLMRKDLPTLIQKARDSHILDRMFHTNGSLLNKKLSKELIASGLTKINFSLDAASSEVYKKVRPGGDYEKVLSNINDFLAAKKEYGKSYPRVRVSFIITPENRHEQSKFYDLWKDKVNVISFQRCYDFTQFNYTDSYDLNPNREIKHCCTQLWQLLTITYEGDLLICERDYKHNHVLGNLKTHTIHECWHSKTMNEFRKLHRENRWFEIPICRKCVTSVEEKEDIKIEI